MLYISSACIKSNNIVNSVKEIAKYGYKNIELSGGTKYLVGYEKELLRLKESLHLNYQIHNYFPPPKSPFMLNLCSNNELIIDKSLDLCSEALRISKIFKGTHYGIHAGFLIDFSYKEAGKRIKKRKLLDKYVAIKNFKESWAKLKERANGTKLYLENNVVSRTNFKTYGTNPFLLTNYEDYIELKRHLDFNLLLDVAHLKVSANTLGLNFKEQLFKLLPFTDYVHLSDNNSLSDQNKGLKENSELIRYLKEFPFKKKTTFTFEIYSGINQVANSIDIFKKNLKFI
tara:strand:- start:1502 stop:2359 length:858 start_codon:yes stop_codon:yes gene_type:complete